MKYPNQNNSLFVYNKQGQINEVPILFQDNTEYSVKASALPNEDCIIIGVMFQNQLLQYFDGLPLFNNLSNIEKFLIQQSTNTSFVIPSNNYRIGGLPILFEDINQNFIYTSYLKPQNNYPQVNHMGGGNFTFRYVFPVVGSYSLQFFNGSEWVTIVPDDGILNDVTFLYNLSANVYVRVSNDQQEYTEPFYIDVVNLLST